MFDAAAGDTHQLTQTAAQVLQHLQQTSCSCQELATVIFPGHEATSEELAAIAALVHNLHELGLVEPLYP